MKIKPSRDFPLVHCYYLVRESGGAQVALMLLSNVSNSHLTVHLSLSCVVILHFRAASTLSTFSLACVCVKVLRRSKDKDRCILFLFLLEYFCSVSLLSV